MYGRLAGPSMVLGAPIGVTPGSVLFGGAGGVLAQDNTNFFWDDANNRLGLGNATPTRTLDVTGLGRFNAVSNPGGILRIEVPTSANVASFIGTGSTGNIQFGLNGTVAVLFSSSGDIGIGIDTTGSPVAGINASFGVRIFPCTDAGAVQAVSGLFAGNGAPNNANGANGDFYLRGDGTQAGNTVIYHKEAGAWIALITT